MSGDSIPENTLIFDNNMRALKIYFVKNEHVIFLLVRKEHATRLKKELEEDIRYRKPEVIIEILQTEQMPTSYLIHQPLIFNNVTYPTFAKLDDLITEHINKAN